MKHVRKQPQLLKVITDEEVTRIHEASLRILERVGVHFPNHAMLDRLEAVGCKIDRDRQVAKMPADVIMTALKELPKDFSVTPPDDGPPLHIGDGDLKLSMDTAPDVVELMKGRKRRGNLSDSLQGIWVSNALENVRLASGYCLPSELPQLAADVVLYQTLWTYSRKAVATWIYSARSADYILEMARVVAGSELALRQRNLLTYFVEPISPLRYAPHSLEIVLKLTEYACPIYLGPMVTTGGSGPVTLAGTLAMHNAEILQGLVMIYACNPAQPVIYSCHCHAMDMTRGIAAYGAPEQGLLAAAATQLARRYGLAVSGNVMLHDSNTADYMAGFEAAATATYALAAGWEMLGFMGFGTIGCIGSGVGHSLEQAIIQDEALSYLQRMIRSFDVNDETLALDVIERVGIGGNFFAEEHTVRHLRGELWANKGLFAPMGYQQWVDAGAKTITQRAHDRLEEILKANKDAGPVLPPDKVQELERIAQSAITEAESGRYGQQGAP